MTPAARSLGSGAAGAGPPEIELRDAEGGAAVSFPVKAQARARREGIVGTWNGAVRVAVREPAEAGRANAAILRVLAGALGVHARALSLVSGGASARKVVSVRGLSRAEAAARLAARLDGSG